MQGHARRATLWRRSSRRFPKDGTPAICARPPRSSAEAETRDPGTDSSAGTPRGTLAERPLADTCCVATEDRAADAGERRAWRPGSRLFTVRLWKEEVAGGSEFRGSARDVVSGAFRGFRNWSDLAAFMIERMQDDVRGPCGAHTTGGAHTPQGGRDGYPDRND